MTSLSLVDTIVISIVVPVAVLIFVIALITFVLYRRRVRQRRERRSARTAAAAAAAAVTPAVATPPHKQRTHEYDRVHRKPSRRGQYIDLKLAPAPTAVAEAAVPPQEYGPMQFNKRAEYRQSMAHKSPSSRRRHVKNRPAAALPPSSPSPLAQDARRSFVDRPAAPLPQQEPAAPDQWTHTYDRVPKRNSSRKQLLHRGQRSKRSRRHQTEAQDGDGEQPPAAAGESKPKPEPAQELLDATAPVLEQRKRPSSVNLSTLELVDDADEIAGEDGPEKSDEQS